MLVFVGEPISHAQLSQKYYRGHRSGAASRDAAIQGSKFTTFQSAVKGVLDVLECCGWLQTKGKDMIFNSSTSKYPEKYTYVT